MLFKFKSQASADLIMLEADAHRLLKIMLNDDPNRGIVLVKDLPNAINALMAAVQAEEAARQNALAAEPSDEEAAEASPKEMPVRLAQRAAPMLKMLAQCKAHGADLVWGV